MTRLQVHVRYYASARAAAGLEAETLTLPDSASVADAIAAMAAGHPQKLPTILTAASFLLDGVAVRGRSGVLRDGAELDVLPPFAGG